jgi:hypothetical protein
MAILLVLLSSTLVGVASVLLGARRTGVVPMPSSRSARRVIVDVLRGRDRYGTITDLGSGWGGLVRRLARNLPDRTVVAVEHSRLPHLFSRIVAGPAIVPNLRHLRRDIYDLPLQSGEAYVCYLSGTGMSRLRESFERDLPRKGVLVSLAFAMPGWSPVEVRTARDLFHSPVYVYEF